MRMSVCKRLLVGAIVPVVAAALAAGCAGGSSTVNKPGQTGEPKPTSTTEAPATTTTEAVSDGGLSPSSDNESADGAYLVDGTAPDDRTMTIVGGAFLPSTLTVQTGDTVTIKGKGAQAYQLKVGAVQAALVSDGILETYRFDKPGKITLSQDFSGDTATITVEGKAVKPAPPTAPSTTASTTTVATPTTAG